MDMFALDDEVSQWETALPTLRGPARLPVLVPLAWHLRQRDNARATALAREGLELLPATALTPEAQTVTAARLRLVEAEAAWLQGRLAEADTLAAAIAEQLHAHDDRRGCADTRWLRAWIAIDGGDHQGGIVHLEHMAAIAGQTGDTERIAIAEATIARWAVIEDMRAADLRWGTRFQHFQHHLVADAGATVEPAAPIAPGEQGVAAWIGDYFGTRASQGGHYGAAAGHFIRAYEAARATGQLRAAITAAVNVGLDFAILHDHHAALDWLQRALDLARPTGWPRSVGACLSHTADTMRRLGRLDASADLLAEALAVLAPLPAGRSYASALHFLGELSLERADYAAAFDAFSGLEQRAATLRQADLHSIARRGQAHALCFLGRPQEALAAAEHAIELATASARCR